MSDVAVEPLVSARDVSLSYGRGTRLAVDAVDLAIGPGESIGIVGESGCGKTSLARMLVGALTPTAGEVLVSGRAYGSLRRGDPLRRSVQMVFQDPYASLSPRRSARDTVAEVFRVWERLSWRAALERADQTLAEVGLHGDVVHRKPWQLSGGQCQRIGIARALACSPSLVIADEPTSALDVSVQAQILNLLRRLRRSHRLALILVSHDLSVIRYMTQHTVVMYGGRIVERGGTEAVFAAPAHPYTRLLIDSIPGSTVEPDVMRNDVGPDSACVFAARCARFHDECRSRRPELRLRSGQEVACHTPLEDSPIASAVQEHRS